MTKQSEVLIEKTITLRISGNEIISWLQKTKQMPARAENIKVYFEVPGGGDYSNMNLDIDESSPIVVKFKIVETE